MQLSFVDLAVPVDTAPREKNGVVYTRPWVVDLILDFVGYLDTEDLASRFAVEPAAGEGAFLIPMVRRLAASCKRYGRSIAEASGSLRAYELDESSARIARASVVSTLLDLGTSRNVADELALTWVSVGDYLLTWPQSPPADFVVGNPPYIRLEDVPEAVTTVYRKLYRTMVGRADIYIAFFEAALKHLKPGGACGFICADRWMLNHYGTELRRFVSANFGVEAVIEMHRADAFHTQVSAYPAVTIIRKAAQGPAMVASAGADAGCDGSTGLAKSLQAAASGAAGAPVPKGFRTTLVEGWFRDGDPWPCVSPDRLALLKRLEAQFRPLENPTTATRVSIGVATGADGVFVTRDPTLVEPSRLLPLAMASDTRDGSLRWSGHYLVDPWEVGGHLVDLREYPRLRGLTVTSLVSGTSRFGGPIVGIEPLIGFTIN